MEQEEVKEFEPPRYVVCRYFYQDHLRYDKVVHTADSKTLDNSLAFMKLLSNGQPGIFVLLEGGEVAWHDSEKLCYWMVCACQDGKTIPLTSDEKWENRPGMPFLYNGGGDFWDVPIKDVKTAMAE